MQNTVPNLSSSSKIVHVAVAVIERFSSAINSRSSLPSDREILISKRAEHAHQGGFWEFPGGKVEKTEQVTDALSRELFEELGIKVFSEHVSSLIKIDHDYGDKHVLLDVYTVHEFQGTAIGKEGQPIKWVKEKDLLNYTFPDANQAILSACRLPSRYFITPDYETPEEALLGIQEQLDQGVCLLLFRQTTLGVEEYQFWVETILNSLPNVREKMLISGRVEMLDLRCLDNNGVAGVHLPFFRAAELSSRPINSTKWLGVSCHTLDEIKHAQAIGADFITVSPVLHTATHPEANPLGWEVFSDLVRQSKVPVYALGGMMVEYCQQAQDAGGQGIAGIRLFLPK